MPGSAEEWVARLYAPDCSKQDKLAFDKWLAACPENKMAFEHASVTWHMAGACAADPVLRAMAEQDRVEVLKRSKPKFLKFWYLFPATLSAVVAMMIVFYILAPTTEHLYKTDHGMNMAVTLDDGSVVHLNTDTRLKVAMKRHERRLSLEKGEAFFEVAHDADRPFLVSAGNEIVRAIGTKFNVRLQPDQIIVAVAEGRVGVRNTIANIKLEDLFPGEKARVSRQGKLLSLKTEKISTVAAWRFGRIYFSDEKLSDILDEVNRYTIRQIKLGDPALGNMRLSGTFKTGDTAAVLFTLRRGAGLMADQDGDTILLHKKNNTGNSDPVK